MKLNIRAWRTNAKLSQRELAEQLDVTENTVAKWEKYITYMKAPQFMKFCEIVGAKPEEVSLQKE